MIGEALLEASRYARPLVARKLHPRHLNHVEDVLQTAVLKALESTARGTGYDGRNGAALFSWFTSIAVRECLQVIRRHKNHRLDRVVPIEDVEIRLSCPRLNPEQLVIQSQRRRVLAEELMQLSPLRRREMLLISAGEIIGRDETRKARVFRARHEMRRRLTERRDFSR
jgi:DNA-directed RNA polymerase specialized sigma24 family protein